ncbi:subtilisin-like protein [Lactarius indigo]|nr:subtilisin-like protein [Lactarius indigo]
MPCHQLFILSVIAAGIFPDFVTPLTSLWDDMRIKHSWDTVPANWDTLGHPPAGTTIDLHVALKSHNESALIETLYEEQVARLVAPHPDVLELVNSWLEHHGVPTSSVSTSHGGGWLTLTGVPISQANELLGASYQLYRSTGTNDTTILRTVSYALPAVLHRHVQTIVPTTHFASMHTMRQRPQRHSVEAIADMTSRESVMVRSQSNDIVTPADLRWLYRTIAYVPRAKDQNLLGVAGFMNDYPSPADLKTFMSQCRVDAMDATFTTVPINGGVYNPKYPTPEASQNMQYAQAMAYPTPHFFYSTGGVVESTPGTNLPALGDSFTAWLDFMLSRQKVPPTISGSYGIKETITPPEYATALCILFIQLGLRGERARKRFRAQGPCCRYSGASVIFPSGNGGVGNVEDCVVDDGSGRVRFVPMFPASCPYVTSVGGTTGYPEVALSFSGGGFSNYFLRPDYQEIVVPIYLDQLGSKYEGLYNPAGRGIPDIAAQAHKLYNIENNNGFVSSGTSCAAPIVAGIISLHNDYLLSIGRSPLGFLNPWLYGVGIAGINDIIIGSNPGCGTDGFSAVFGWDPVTGLGTPDFLNLLASLDHHPTGTQTHTGTQNPTLDPTSLAKKHLEKH